MFYNKDNVLDNALPNVAIEVNPTDAVCVSDTDLTDAVARF